MRKVKIGDIFRISKGRKADHVTNIKINDARRYIQIEDLRTNNSLQYSLDKNGVFVEENDLCIAWDGANAGTVGYGLTGIIGSTIARLRLEDKNIYTPYVGRFLQTKFYILNGKTTGTTIPHVERSRLDNLELALPSFDEQRRIAAILDKADAIRRKRQQALKLADDFLQSTYLYLCGEKNSDYSDWPDISLDSLASSMHTGPFGSSLKHSEFIQEGIAVLGIDNAVANRFEWRERRFITEEKYAELKRYTAKAGDVIVTIMGTIGRSAVVPDDIPTAISTKHLATIRVDRKQAIPQYISQAIHRDPNLLRQIKQAGKGAIMTGLNLGIIKCLHIRCAPMEQQKKFAEVVSNVNNYIEKILKSSEHEALFSGLCQNFFSK